MYGALTDILNKYGFGDPHSVYAGAAQWDLFSKTGIQLTNDDQNETRFVERGVEDLQKADPKLSRDEALTKAVAQNGDSKLGFMRIYDPSIIQSIT